MKKKFPELLLVLSTLAIISLFFTVYLTRFVTNQRVEAAKIVEAERKKEEQAAQKLAKRTYQEKMNDKIKEHSTDKTLTLEQSVMELNKPKLERSSGIENIKSSEMKLDEFNKNAEKETLEPAIEKARNNSLKSVIEENKEKIEMLIKTFFNRLKGYHVQYNVVSKETLLDAQAHPEKHKDLIVRVAGYSAFFNVLSKATQDDIIGRTEQTL